MMETKRTPNTTNECTTSQVIARKQLEVEVERDRLKEVNGELLAALERLTLEYCGVVNSGDCGDWEPEMDVCVIKARAAIAKATGQDK